MLHISWCPVHARIKAEHTKTHRLHSLSARGRSKKHLSLGACRPSYSSTQMFCRATHNTQTQHSSQSLSAQDSFHDNYTVLKAFMPTKPKCQLCYNHRPSRRVRCLDCSRQVGPGCVPSCLYISGYGYWNREGVELLLTRDQGLCIECARRDGYLPHAPNVSDEPEPEPEVREANSRERTTS